MDIELTTFNPALLVQTVERAKTDNEARRELYEGYYLRVYRFLFAYTNDQTEAEDLTSQTFLTAFQALPQLRDPSRFTSWLFRISRNHAHDYYRRLKRNPNLPLVDFEEMPAQTDSLDRNEVIFIRQLVNRLTSSERDLLLLHLIAGFSFPELAQMFEQPETRLKKRYYRLLGRLKAQME